MTLNAESLKRKLTGANDLYSLVKTMKSLAAVQVCQFEEAVVALQDYHATVDKAMIAYLVGTDYKTKNSKKVQAKKNILIIFGTDLGMVGNFNESISMHALNFSKELKNIEYWAVGNKISSCLKEKSIVTKNTISTPDSLNSLTSIVTRLVQDLHFNTIDDNSTKVYLCHNRFLDRSNYNVKFNRLLPFDDNWYLNYTKSSWSSNCIPNVICNDKEILSSLTKELLFVELFKALAESIMSENAARLEYMQRAEKKIEDILEDLKQDIRKVRQSNIDSQLFEVISSYEAQRKDKLIQ